MLDANASAHSTVVAGYHPDSALGTLHVQPLASLLLFAFLSQTTTTTKTKSQSHAALSQTLEICTPALPCSIHDATNRM